MTEPPVDPRQWTIGIVGVGVMGRGIGQAAAAAGFAVRLYDIRSDVAREGRDFAHRMLQRAAQKGRMSPHDAAAAVARLEVVERLEDLAGSDVVVEAIAEDLKAKRQLFATLEDIVGEECILATNTSSFLVTRIAAACRRPGRVAGLHFFNPVPLMRVVEVVSAVHTEPRVADFLGALAQRLGHKAVRVKDRPGFLINHASRGFGIEAQRILMEGVAEPVDIDRVMREAAGFPMGPFELLDLIGLDVSLPAIESIYHQFYQEPRFRPSPEIAVRAAGGLLGRKSGEGFYRYADGRPQLPPEAEVPADRPETVWIGADDDETRTKLVGLIEAMPAAVSVERASGPSPDALCLVAPLGVDTTTVVFERQLDPRRTVAIDALLGLDRRITLMATPAVEPKYLHAAHGLIGSGGVAVTVIRDSPGFIAQRILAAVVNVACEVAQQRIAAPSDIDEATKLALGYPTGPLTLGDHLGPRRILRILENLQRVTGDARYRASLWLRRRALLDLSLTTPDDNQS